MFFKSIHCRLQLFTHCDDQEFQPLTTLLLKANLLTSSSNLLLRQVLMEINMSGWNWKHKSAVLIDKTGVDVFLTLSLTWDAPSIFLLL